jgi:tetratricopeptide (TPR) repeat protein
MRAGNDGAAQVAFQQLAADYPQFPGARINLGILHRKAGRLEQAETALVEALARNRENAIAWNELGVTQRMKGEFQMAQDSYENAIRADPDYAPAYRNLGVLLDLYMGDANGALDNLERYKELTNEDKPVTGWIAELRQRTGRKAPRPPAPEPAAEEAPAAVGGGNGETSNGDGADASSPEGSESSAPADGSSNDGNATDGASGEGAPADGAPPAEPQRAGL